MGTRMIQARKIEDLPKLGELYLEHTQWISSMFNQTYGVKIEEKDLKNWVEADLLKLDQFMPPKGRLLLYFADDVLAGMAGMREIGMDIGEIKRMYVRPAFRRMGFGREMLNRLIEEAYDIGYHNLRLDTARFMTEAQQLYRSVGFREIAPYEGSEIISDFPKEFHSAWIFMEKVLV